VCYPARFNPRAPFLGRLPGRGRGRGLLAAVERAGKKVRELAIRAGARDPSA